MLHLEAVNKIYNEDIKALDNVSLRISKGEMVGLLGPTGAGKTTLLKLVIGEEKPDGGEIAFNSHKYSLLKKKEFWAIRQKIGIIFQDERLLKDKSILENVALSMRVLNKPEREVRKKSLETLGMLGLSNKKNCFPEELSSGERQKVCFARSIVKEPVLLLADEPTRHLDDILSEEILFWLKKINLSGTTVFLTTNQKQITEKLSGRIILIEQGQIRAQL